MFLETICIINGKVQNIDAHINRMRQTAEYFKFKAPVLPILEELLTSDIKNTKVKCSIHYHNIIKNISFNSYIPREIYSLKLIKAHPDYAFKYSDRKVLENLLDYREDCDEVLIIRDGFITDTTFSNVVLQKGDELFTPHCPILNGTKRQKLIKEGRISEKEIKVKSLKDYSHVYLINAMLDIEDNISVPIDMINK